MGIICAHAHQHSSISQTGTIAGNETFIWFSRPNNNISIKQNVFQLTILHANPGQTSSGKQKATRNAAVRAERGFVMKETVTVITTLNVLVPCFVVKITAPGVTEMIVVCSQV